MAFNLKMKKPKPHRFFVTCPGCRHVFDLMKARHGWITKGQSFVKTSRRTPYVECPHCKHVF